MDFCWIPSRHWKTSQIYRLSWPVFYSTYSCQQNKISIFKLFPIVFSTFLGPEWPSLRALPFRVQKPSKFSEPTPSNGPCNGCCLHQNYYVLRYFNNRYVNSLNVWWRYATLFDLLFFWYMIQTWGDIFIMVAWMMWTASGWKLECSRFAVGL